MKINEETTISEEQILFNKLSYEEQQFILKQMRMLQPCELSCELEEKKIPEKIPEEIIIGKKHPTHRIKKIEKKINEIISYLVYLKSKGDE